MGVQMGRMSQRMAVLFIVINDDGDGSVVRKVCNNRISTNVAAGHSFTCNSEPVKVKKWNAYLEAAVRRKKQGMWQPACATRNIVQSSSVVNNMLML